MAAKTQARTTKAQVLSRTEFGHPLLRAAASPVSFETLKSREFRQLIRNMRHTLVSKKLGVGLAAPQVGKAWALAVIVIRPTSHRPDVKPFDLTLINPRITEEAGRRISLWEGCLSGGENNLFAKVPRYKKIRVRYQDETGRSHHKYFQGLPAHVIQHEVDHLNGILFVDRVRDTTTYTTLKEYKKLRKTGKLDS